MVLPRVLYHFQSALAELGLERFTPSQRPPFWLYGQLLSEFGLVAGPALYLLYIKGLDWVVMNV